MRLRSSGLSAATLWFSDLKTMEAFANDVAPDLRE
jgi:hypothetical protein